MKKLYTLIILCALLIATMPVHAQGDGRNGDEDALIKNLNLAYAALSAVEALEFEAAQTLDQTVTVPSIPGVRATTDTTVMVAGLLVQVGDGDYNAAFRVQDDVRANLGDGPFSRTRVVDMRLIDGEAYAKLVSIEPEEFGYPDSWFAVEDNILHGQELEIYANEIATLEEFLPREPLSDVALLSVSALDEETFNDEPHLIIVLEFDPVELYRTNLYASANRDLLAGMGMTNTMIEGLLANSTLTHTIWLNITTGTISQIEIRQDMDTALPVELTDGIETVLVQTSVYRYTLFPLDEVPTIEVPKLGSVDP